ncbi:MAG: Smr/MutS family protein [Candidatus Electronema sp. V4]|uniref:Smr/MutS family protein n=1 Tax=Candidatus Electronema sp. V4 TaxID=3454756 RepID=UPI00405597FD
MRELCCGICGNEVDPGLRRCPYCESALELVLPGQLDLHKIVNLKQGMPTVEQALLRFDRELAQAKLERRRVLTLIHGYGSSGAGGFIRQEVRARLLYLQHQGGIREIVCGEDFNSRSGPGRNILRCFPVLRQHGDLNKGNLGITLVAV